MSDSSREECTAPAKRHKYGKMTGVADDATHKGHCTVGSVGSNWTGQKVVADGLEPWKMMLTAVRGHMLEPKYCKDRCSIEKYCCIG